MAILSAAAGRAGGTKAQSSLRLCLTAFRPHLLTGPEVAVASAGNEFDKKGQLSDQYAKSLTELMQALRRAVDSRGQ